MGLLTSPTGRRMMDGTARILMAELLFPLTALITTGFLTRELGPQGYGLLALTLTTIIWIESAINSFFARATLKFVGETGDWKPVGAMVVRFSAKIGVSAMVLLWILAGPLSALFNEPEFAFYIRLGALDIPILCLGQAYRNVLLGMGNYQGGAVARAGRWLARMCLVVVLVETGLSIAGALLGVIGSSAVELWISQRRVGPGMFIKQAAVPIPIRRYGVLLFLSSLCLIIYNGMDLFMLKILGGTATQAGIYSAAQSLSLLPGLFSWTFSSLLLATLSRQLADGQRERARELACDAMRVTRLGHGDRAGRVRFRVYAVRISTCPANLWGYRERDADGVADDRNRRWASCSNGSLHCSVGSVGSRWPSHIDSSFWWTRSRACHRCGVLTWCVRRCRECVWPLEGVPTGWDLLT